MNPTLDDVQVRSRDAADRSYPGRDLFSLGDVVEYYTKKTLGEAARLDWNGVQDKPNSVAIPAHDFLIDLALKLGRVCDLENTKHESRGSFLIEESQRGQHPFASHPSQPSTHSPSRNSNLS